LSESIGREVIAPDLPGHGKSACDPASIDDTLAAVCNVLSSFVSRVPLLGYSQGGRVGLLAALRCPAMISSLVLISANAGIEDEQLRRNRVTQDDAQAARIELLGVERFLNEWTTTGVTSTAHLDDVERAADRAVRLENSAEGLAAALRGYGQGVQPVVWPRLEELEMPVLVISGSEDSFYSDIARRMSRAITGSELVLVPGAGHNPLMEAPEATIDAVSGFLDRHG
jgi:2-succinyl-6-hydroxy-2,4-cyclohexadiene-1-carboxylate synthase